MRRGNLRESTASNEEYLGGVPPGGDLPTLNHDVNGPSRTEFLEFQIQPLSNNEATSPGKENIPWLRDLPPRPFHERFSVHGPQEEDIVQVRRGQLNSRVQGLVGVIDFQDTNMPST